MSITVSEALENGHLWLLFCVCAIDGVTCLLVFSLICPFYT